MRHSPALLALPPLLLVLCWALVGGTNLDRPALDRAGAALSDVALATLSLRTDVLSARAGLLRNYDPIVGQTRALRAALDRLARSGAAVDGIDRLDGLLRRNEDLIERFKSDNALLQNSLAYFADFSQRIGTENRDATLVDAAHALAASMLRFTLDTSPASAAEVDAQLGQQALQAGFSHQPATASLMAHARLLRLLLPEIDALVRSITALPWAQGEAAAQASLAHARWDAHRRVAGYRLLLSASFLLLLALLTHLGIRLRKRSLAQQRSGQFNRLLTQISVRLSDAGPRRIEEELEWALGCIAVWVGADHVSLLTGAARRKAAFWQAAPAAAFAWPDGVLGKLARLTASVPSPQGGSVVHVRLVSRLEPGELKDLLARGGVAGWVGVACAAQPRPATLLGLATIGRALRLDADEAVLLRMALDTLVTALERTDVERERLRLDAGLQRWQRMERVAALTGGVAHNFNNIVGAILGHAEMAEARATTDQELASSLAQVRQAGERARDLTDQILAFGRRRDFMPVPVEMRALLAETRAQLGVMLPPGITLAPHGPDRDVIVLGEAEQLQQVIVNLCSNAAQAMSGRGTVELGLSMRENPRESLLSNGTLPPGTWVVVSVRDEGRGIDRAILPRIFEPFFTTRREGNGLGLATVRDIVQEHGGQIDVGSVPGQGSLFEVFVPMAAAAAREAAGMRPSVMRGSGQTILVFNSDGAALLRDEEFVAAFGYEPIGFSSDAMALGAAADAPKRFDAALLAHGEDEMAGLLASRLRTLSSGLPILLTTGKDIGISAERARRFALDDIAVSVAEPSRLAAALAKQLAARRRLDA